VNVAFDGTSYPRDERCDTSGLQPQRETYQNERCASLMEKHHRPCVCRLIANRRRMPYRAEQDSDIRYFSLDPARVQLGMTAGYR
jgi:hypothetical protein